MEPNILQSGVIFLLAAVLVVPIAQRLQLGAVLGYLLAGVLIGPYVLGLIEHPETVASFSELGVVLLLFIIGLELSPRRLWVMRKSVFGVGLLQVLLTGLLIGGVALFFFHQPVNSAIVLGLGLALSSTAFGLQILAERKELQQPHGRLAFAILLFQDIAAIPLIALIPLLSGAVSSQEDSNELQHIIKVVGSIGLVILGGRYLLRPVFRFVAATRLRDMFTATALLVVLGTAWLMELVNVSMPLGAFLAGMLLADSEYRHELESQIEPFKGLLLGLFFISVGMTADVRLFMTEPLTILGLTILLIALKMPVLYGLGRFPGGLSAVSAIRLGAVLAAGGEFAFVLFNMAHVDGLFDAALHNLLVLSITLSMAITPLLVLLVSSLVKFEAPKAPPPPELEDIQSDHPRVVIAGTGRMGQIIARVLQAQGIPYVALDTSVETIEWTRSINSDIPFFYGDPRRPEILSAAQVESAEFFIVAVGEVDVSLQIVDMLQKRFPHLKIIARARDRQHVFELMERGVTPVRETFFSSLEMARLVLLGTGLSEELTDVRIRRFRRHDEKLLKTQQDFKDDRQALIKSSQDAKEELEQLFNEDRTKHS